MKPGDFTTSDGVIRKLIEQGWLSRADDGLLEVHDWPQRKGDRLDKQGPVLAVIDHYRHYHPRSIKSPHAGMKEWRAVQSRLKEGFSVQDLCDAIDGCHRSPFHCGDNKDRRKYQHLELIVRSASHVQQFMEVPMERPSVSQATQRVVDAVDEWIHQERQQGVRDASLCLEGNTGSDHRSDRRGSAHQPHQERLRDQRGAMHPPDNGPHPPMH